ncbi:MAG: hypothetical protein HUU25_03045 [Candidatus Sumerlaeia bacterium]|nr:hypothetical protein [Candidatus Sumerlaeia bacterium]
MSQTVEAIGVYPFEGSVEPCHVVELVVHGADGDFPIFDFTQERPGLPQTKWRMPHCAKIMDATGTKVLADAAGTCDQIDLWLGDVRLAFYFHHLDPSLPFRTPFGEVALPPVAPLPERLRGLEYVEDFRG